MADKQIRKVELNAAKAVPQGKLPLLANPQDKVFSPLPRNGWSRNWSCPHCLQAPLGPLRGLQALDQSRLHLRDLCWEVCPASLGVLRRRDWLWEDLAENHRLELPPSHIPLQLLQQRPTGRQ